MVRSDTNLRGSVWGHPFEKKKSQNHKESPSKQRSIISFTSKKGKNSIDTLDKGKTFILNYAVSAMNSLNIQ